MSRLPAPLRPPPTPTPSRAPASAAPRCCACCQWTAAGGRGGGRRSPATPAGTRSCQGGSMGRHRRAAQAQGNHAWLHHSAWGQQRALWSCSVSRVPAIPSGMRGSSRSAAPQAHAPAGLGESQALGYLQGGVWQRLERHQVMHLEPSLRRDRAGVHGKGCAEKWNERASECERFWLVGKQCGKGERRFGLPSAAGRTWSRRVRPLQRAAIQCWGPGP
jgi:hypothetical protein